MTSTGLARLGALLADPTRAEILTALMDGRAHTGSELARHVGVAPSTVSEHLSRLLDADMASVEAQGRHRYYRLANPQIAELLETLGASGNAAPPGSPRASSDLVHARTCYDHLAGELAVTIHRQLLAQGHLVESDHHLTISPAGLELFASIGVDVDAITTARRPKARSCLDWTQRRHHLAGAAGSELLAAFFANQWIRRGQRPRSIRVTDVGKAAITSHFQLPGV